MTVVNNIKNFRLRYNEKLSNSYTRQLIRLGRMLCRRPRAAVRQGILKVMINVTYRCECRCDYCWCGEYEQIPGKELTTAEIKKILDEISSHPSLLTLVSFIGGEPLLRDDIPSLITYAQKKGLFTEMETNGFALTPKIIHELKTAGLHHLFVKVEGSSAESHDAQAQLPECFKKAIDGVKESVRRGLSCSIFINAQREKIEKNELEEIIALGKALNVRSVRMIHPTLSGKWLTAGEQLLDSSQEQKVQALLEPGFVYLESSYAADTKSSRICSALNRKFFHISCYGEVQPCPFVPLDFGNIRAKPLEEIVSFMWSHPLFTKTYRGCPMNDVSFRTEYILPSRLDLMYQNIPMDTE